jgi:hypothetical protein
MRDQGGLAVTDGESGARPARWTMLFIVLLPLILFHWMTPGIGDKILGNDYTLYTPNEQLNLLFSIHKGSFPLYAPGYWWGQSATALTLSQIYHPVTWLSNVLPKYWDGGVIPCMTLVKLFTLGFAQLALFALLCRMKFKHSIAFLLSFIAVYNLRMLDLFRYNASLESYTGMLFLCAATGWFFLEPARKLPPFAIVAATYWTLTGGHPQMAYYGIAGAAAWTIVFPVVARTLETPIDEKSESFMRYWLKTGVFVAAGVALSACYLVPYWADFIRENAARVKRGYDWSILLSDTPQGTAANLFFPLRSDVHSAFGGPSIYLLGALATFAGILNTKRRSASLLLSALLVVLLLFSLGDATPFHHWCWNYVPFCSAVRGPGRIFQIAPVVLMLGLMTAFSNSRPAPEPDNDHSLYYPAIAAAALSLLAALMPFWNDSTLNQFAALKINALGIWREKIVFAVGLAVPICLILSRKLKSPHLPLALCGATVLQMMLLLPCGTWTVAADVVKKPTFEQMAQGLSRRLAVPDMMATGLEAPLITKLLDDGGEVDTRMATAFSSIRAVGDRDETNRLLREMEKRTPLQPNEPVLLAQDIPGFTPAANAEQNYQIKLEYSSYNRLEFACLASPGAGIFKLNYPFSEKWSCRVNDAPATIYLANNTEMAVQIPAGASKVEFRYWSPASAWGWGISCLMLALICSAGIFSAFPVGGMKAGAAVLGPLLLAGGVFALWQRSIYSGENLKTAYAYSSRDAEAQWQRRAIAFNRGNTVPIQKMFRRLIAGTAEAMPHWVEYDFELSGPGDYQVGLNYLATQPAPMKLLVNGQYAGLVADGVSDPIPEWHAEKIKIHFNAGKNVVRLESATQAGMPALYKLRFTRPGG